MTLKEFCKKYGLTEAQATGKEEVGGSLDLRSGSKYIGAKVEIPHISALYLWRNKELDKWCVNTSKHRVQIIYNTK